jgi:hypothetical protein
MPRTKTNNPGVLNSIVIDACEHNLRLWGVVRGRDYSRPPDPGRAQ